MQKKCKMHWYHGQMLHYKPVHVWDTDDCFKSNRSKWNISLCKCEIVVQINSKSCILLHSNISKCYIYIWGAQKFNWTLKVDYIISTLKLSPWWGGCEILLLLTHIYRQHCRRSTCGYFGWVWHTEEADIRSKSKQQSALRLFHMLCK